MYIASEYNQHLVVWINGRKVEDTCNGMENFTTTTLVLLVYIFDNVCFDKKSSLCFDLHFEYFGFRPAPLNESILFNRGIRIWPEHDFSFRHYIGENPDYRKRNIIIFSK